MLFQNVTRSNLIGTFDPKYLRMSQQAIPHDDADRKLDRSVKKWTIILFISIIVFGGAVVAYGISTLPY